MSETLSRVKTDLNENASSRRHMRRHLAWSVALLSLALAVVGFAICALALVRSGGQGWLAAHIWFSPVLTLTYALVGALVASRQPRNPIGWICSAVGFLSGLNLLAFGYGLAHAAGVVLPGDAIVYWLGLWVWIPATFLPLTFLLLLFPDGHLPSTRWRLAGWSAGLAVAAYILGTALNPNPSLERNPTPNPFGIPGAAGLFDLLVYVGTALIAFGAAGSVAALVVRLRRSRGLERAQLKWLAYAGVLGLLGNIAIYAWGAAQPPDATSYELMLTGIFVMLMAIAAAAGVAILRHRLYDIDIIINRTLVYGSLSAGVILVYILLVGLFSALLNTDVNLAAALVTIPLAALMFSTFRARVERLVNPLAGGRRQVPAPSQQAGESPAGGRMRSRRRWLTLAYAAWLVCAALVLLLFLASIPLGYLPYVRHSAAGSGNTPYAEYIPLFYFLSGAVSFLVASVSLLLAALLFWKRRNEILALSVSFYLLAYAIFSAGPQELAGGFRGQIYSGLISAIGNAGWLFPILFLYLFPSGQFVPRWSRWAAGLLLPLTIFSMVDPDSLGQLTNPRLYFILLGVACLVGAGIYAQIHRYRRASTVIERQQIKWVAFGVSFNLVLLTVTTIPYMIIESMPGGRISSSAAWAPVGDMIWWLLMSILPLTLAFAVMRYRLWDVDIIINRALVFGALTVGVVALYVILVGALGALSQTTGNLLISLLATGLIAFLFQPLRERLQRGVNRLMYGERDEPYALMARLGENLQTNTAPDAMLVTLVRTIAQALKLPYVAIETDRNGKAEIAAEHGQSSSQLQRIPLPYQGETVGQLLVAPRGPNEPLSPPDLNLLRIIAQQAGMAVHAVQLTEDLQRSRERLVVAREEERRRIRRNLHDGLGPALASLAMQADNAREWTGTDPSKTEAALADITAKAQDALQDIRRLVYDLRPPALDELGLVGALRQTASNSANGLHIEIDTPESLPPLSAAVEVAAYRIAQETLNNVMRHSHARKCTLRIFVQDELQLEIRDDGVGLPHDVRAGVGLVSMRERAAELGGSCLIEPIPGGGTRVLARLPLAHQHNENG